MTNTPSPSVSTDVVTDLVARYGRQAIQLFAAFAGATGLFYSVGFIIVNVSLLRLGVYETALISVGYVAPGIAFAVIFTLSAATTIGVFEAWRRLLGPRHDRRLLAALLSAISMVGGSYLLGWAMWFFQNVALGLAAWSIAVSLGVAIMAYAEHLPLVKQILTKRVDADGNPMSPTQARLKSPAFILVSAALAFFSILLYGMIVYEQIPPVFGGGLPIVVRFFGADVGELDRIGINLEPGETAVTERVELIAQTQDRYIVRVANRALSFDKLFVQGIRYEPPEFFLDKTFFLDKHTRLGEELRSDGRYDEALSEFNLVLDREPRYAPALRNRVLVLIGPLPDFAQALQDYLALIDVEPQNAENFYGLAKAHILLAQSAGQDIAVGSVVWALTSTKTISPTLGEKAKTDPIFDPLRGTSAFDVAVYESGPAGARWFAGQARSFEESGATDDAIAAYRRAIEYAGWYPSEADSLSTIDVADLHVALGGLYDPFSEEALSELQLAVETAGQDDPRYLILLADLYLARGDTANALATYDLALERLTADDPDRRRILIGIGRTALQEQDYLRASAAFGQAVALFESDAATWYDYARALAALGDAATEMALRRAFELDLGLAARAQTEDWAQYFSGAGSAVENLINGAVHFKQAQDLRDQGDLDGALVEFQNATTSDDSVVEYWLALGDTLTQAERHAEAAAAYQAALLRLPERDPAVLVSLGSAQLASGDPVGAIESLSEAIAAQGDATFAATHALLGQAYELTEQFDLAAAAYELAASRDPDNLDYPYHQGVDLLLAGQIEPGQAVLESAIAQGGGGLSVTSSEAAVLRDSPSLGGIVLKALSVGAVLSLVDQPQPNEGQVWWRVADQDGAEGWVSAADVAPQTLAPGIQFSAP